jgi:purine-binding chemotaxis protein CheW
VSAQSQDAIDVGAVRKRLAQAEDVLAGNDTEADRARILAERAEAVARTREEAQVGGLPVLAFKLGGERYAVEVGTVFQVVDASGLTPLPATPPWVLGAIQARTRVVPVLDLRALLGLEGGGMSDLSKAVILEDGGELFGVAVEELEGRLDLDRERLAAPSDGPFAWIAPDRLAVLDLPRLGAPMGRGN